MRQAARALLVISWCLSLAVVRLAGARERSEPVEKHPPVPKENRCCGYPIGEFRLSFYWLAREEDHVHEPYDTTVFAPNGWPIGRFPAAFVKNLTRQGTAVLIDGRILNIRGRCRYGTGYCFIVVDREEHHVGIGVRGRPLVPFRSVAVDPKRIPIGEPLYFPELDGIELPDGTLHDGCVRADDRGGAIRGKEIDFFVASPDDFKKLANGIWWKMHVTPTLEEPRCQYLREWSEPWALDTSASSSK